MKLTEIKFSSATRVELLDKIFRNWIHNRKPEIITVLDASSIVRADRDIWYEKYLRQKVNIFADGYYVYLSCKLLGINVAEQVMGYDLTIDILTKAKSNNVKIYFLGAAPQVVEKLLVNVERLYSKEIIGGSSHGYYHDSELDDLIEKINNTESNILLIGMGYPRREEFIEYAKSKIQLGSIIGVGGVFDILGEKTSRAPKFLVKIKLEWFYRFILEPKRMFGRVFVDYPYFVLKILMEIVNKSKAQNG